MTEAKILEIIAKDYVFTVKNDARWLQKIIARMEDKKLVEIKDSYKDCAYYGPADGREWTLKDGFES